MQFSLVRLIPNTLKTIDLNLFAYPPPNLSLDDILCSTDYVTKFIQNHIYYMLYL